MFFGRWSKKKENPVQEIPQKTGEEIFCFKCKSRHLSTIDCNDVTVKCLDCGRDLKRIDVFQAVSSSGRIVDGMFEKTIVKPLCKDCYSLRESVLTCDLPDPINVGCLYGHWVFEKCPYHEPIKCKIENCSLCNEEGDIQFFVECDPSSHKKKGVSI